MTLADAARLTAVSFQPRKDVEVPPLVGPGTAIRVLPMTRRDGKRTLQIVGVCQVLRGEAPFESHLLEAVWITAIRGPRPEPYCFPVVGDTLVFPDDVQSVGDVLRGVFVLDMFGRIGVEPVPGLYFVTATLGPYLSTVVEATL